MGKLSDTQLRGWVKKGSPIAGKSDGGGLTFTLSKAGTAAWVIRYRHAGKQSEYCIGRYPDIPLSEARGIAADLRKQVQQGVDIAALKREKAARESEEEAKKKLHANSVKALAAKWVTRSVSATQQQRVLGTLNRYAIPVIGALPPESVTPAHIDHILQATVKAGAPTTANDLLRYLKRLFSYARKRRLITSNPAQDFDTTDAGGREHARSRALSLEEISAFFEAMQSCDTLGRDNELAFRLLLLLGVRKGEIVGAQWEEFDLESGVWTIPPSRTKTNEGIRIPLPALALTWLRELEIRAAGSTWVFPARRIGRRRLGHVSPDTLNAALSRIGHNLPPFTVHDLRRTLRTHLAALGITPHIAERVLNHKQRGMAGIYDRHDYFEDRRAALDLWAGVLSELEQGAKVVPLFRAGTHETV